MMPAPRCRPPARLVRWLALLPLLLAAVWLLHLASHLQGEEGAGPAAESCLVCLHLGGHATPLAATAAPMPLSLAAFEPAIARASRWRHLPTPLPRQGAPPRS